MSVQVFRFFIEMYREQKPYPDTCFIAQAILIVSFLIFLREIDMTLP